MCGLLSLLAPSPRLRVDAQHAAARPVLAEPVHAAQRVQRTWLVRSAVPTQLRKLSTALPGLTIVRVGCPSSHKEGCVDVDADGRAVVASVRVTSDAAEHLARVRVTAKKASALRLTFKSDRRRPMGTLVTEIDVARGASVHELLAAAGGDVVVASGVLARGQSGVSVVAFDRSRLFVDETQDESLEIRELGVGSIHGGCVYVSLRRVAVRDTLGCSVVGDGLIHLEAEGVRATHVKVGTIDAGGRILLNCGAALDACDIKGLVWGSGSVVLAAAAAATETLSLHIDGRGCIDAACVEASQTSAVTIRENGCAAVHNHAALALECGAHATVECVGGSPAHGASSGSSRMNRLTRKHHRERTRRINPGRPEPQSVASAFENPRVLRTQRVGFRDKYVCPVFANIRRQRSRSEQD